MPELPTLPSLCKFYGKNRIEQECIPVGCVPSAAVAIHGGRGSPASVHAEPGPGDPLGVGLETPPGVGLETPQVWAWRPPDVWAWSLPPARALNFPPGVGLETPSCCKACWDTTCNAFWDTTPLQKN